MFCIKVMLSPLRRILPETNPEKNISKRHETMDEEGYILTERFPGFLLDVDFLGIIQHQVHVLVKTLQGERKTREGKCEREREREKLTHLPI